MELWSYADEELIDTGCFGYRGGIRAGTARGSTWYKVTPNLSSSTKSSRRADLVDANWAALGK